MYIIKKTAALYCQGKVEEFNFLPFSENFKKHLLSNLKQLDTMSNNILNALQSDTSKSDFVELARIYLNYGNEYSTTDIFCQLLGVIK